MKEIQRALDILAKTTEVIANFLMVSLFVVVNLGVFSRYIFLSPFYWTEELALFILAWMVFLAGSQVIRKWENVRVTFFIDKLPSMLSSLVDIFLKFLVLSFLFYAAVLAVEVIPKVGPTEIATALGISMLLPQMSLVVGLVLMVIQAAGITLEAVVALAGKGRA